MSWVYTIVPSGNNKGVPILSVLAKKTYTISNQHKPVEAKEQELLVESDVYTDPDNPMYSDVLAETDMAAYKLSTDVIILGKARSPKGKKAYHLDCDARVGPLKKTVRVFGNRKAEERTFRGISIGDPEPFNEIEFCYSNAFGGVTRNKEGTLFAYYPNPIGKGFSIKGGFENILEIELPNLEDVEFPLTPDNVVLSKFEEWKTAPKPASMGWTKRSFYPRYTYAGVLPEYLDAATKNLADMKKENPGIGNVKLTAMDFRVYQGASDGLWGKKLLGNEPIKLTYMDARFPVFESELPQDYPTITLDIGEGSVELERNLHTVVIDKEKNILTMLWRGSMEYGGVEELAQLKKLEAEVV